MNRLLVLLWLVATVAFVVEVLWPAMQDNHRRGMARVHRGRSWDDR